jgi:hypothetical protein
VEFGRKVVSFIVAPLFAQTQAFASCLKGDAEDDEMIL